MLRACHAEGPACVQKGCFVGTADLYTNATKLIVSPY